MGDPVITLWRRKPTVIRAVRWTGDNMDEVVTLWGYGPGRIDGSLLVLTRNGQDVVFVARDHWLVEKRSRGSSGGRVVYPQSTAQLSRKYEMVVEPATVTPDDARQAGAA